MRDPTPRCARCGRVTPDGYDLTFIFIAGRPRVAWCAECQEMDPLFGALHPKSGATERRGVEVFGALQAVEARSPGRVVWMEETT